MIAHLPPPPPTRPEITTRIEELVQTALTSLPPDPRDTPTGPGRPRTLPSLPLWASLIVGLVQGLSSYAAIWRLISAFPVWGLPAYTVTDQAVADRLEAAGTQRLELLFAQLSELVAARLAPLVSTELASFATEVYALDQTVLDTLARMLPPLRALPAGNPHLLAGKLTGLFDLRRQQWHRLRYLADPCESEQLSAWSMVQQLAPGSLILADLGYFCFEWFDDLTDLGYFWLSRLQSKVTYTVLHTYYHQGTTLDCLVFLGAYRFTKAGHAVRLVQFEVDGTLFQYLTNVLDPQEFPLTEIAQVYARRWDIELAVKVVKRELGLHLIWSAKPILIQQQLWAVLCIAQIVHALQLEVAVQAGVDPFDVSLPLLLHALPQCVRLGQDPVAFLAQHGARLGIIRPSRRIRPTAPLIDLALVAPCPPDLALHRPPRYARTKGKGYHTAKEEAITAARIAPAAASP